jgi:excisionase family DNA binding protein
VWPSFVPHSETKDGHTLEWRDSASDSGLDALRDIAGGSRRVTVETADDSIAVGRHSFLPSETPEVLTVAELADLLKAEPEVVEALADERRVPARRIGDEWRFARAAVLEWLAAGDEAED